MSDDALKEAVHAAAGTSLLRRALDASRTGRAVKVIEFDGCGARFRGIPLALRTLNADENFRVRAEALKWLSTTCGFELDFLVETDSGENITEFETKVRTIALALVEPAPPHRAVAKDADEIRVMLDADEVSALFELYVDWVQERSPISAAKTAEEVASVVDALGKGTMPMSRLSAYDSVSLRSIAIELVARWRTQTSSPSSPTSPLSSEGITFSEPSD